VFCEEEYPFGVGGIDDFGPFEAECINPCDIPCPDCEDQFALE